VIEVEKNGRHDAQPKDDSVFYRPYAVRNQHREVLCFGNERGQYSRIKSTRVDLRCSKQRGQKWVSWSYIRAKYGSAALLGFNRRRVGGRIRKPVAVGPVLTQTTNVPLRSARGRKTLTAQREINLECKLDRSPRLMSSGQFREKWKVIAFTETATMLPFLRCYQKRDIDALPTGGLNRLSKRSSE
jgi:hypothetical protein